MPQVFEQSLFLIFAERRQCRFQFSPPHSHLSLRQFPHMQSHALPSNSHLASPSFLPRKSLCGNFLYGLLLLLLLLLLLQHRLMKGLPPREGGRPGIGEGGEGTAPKAKTIRLFQASGGMEEKGSFKSPPLPPPQPQGTKERGEKEKKRPAIYFHPRRRMRRS